MKFSNRLSPSHFQISCKLINYMNNIASHLSLSDQIIKEKLTDSEYRLISYAEQYWLDHLLAVTKNVTEEELLLFRKLLILMLNVSWNNSISACETFGFDIAFSFKTLSLQSA